jgi:hypothetical protein
MLARGTDFLARSHLAWLTGAVSSCAAAALEGFLRTVLMPALRRSVEIRGERRE